MDQQIWQWTLTKGAIAPCFVRDVLDLRQPANTDHDFFWLGHTPCRTVLLVGMVVAVQNYDKRAIYTIDDGTAVIDCILRHPQPSLHTRQPHGSTGGQTANSRAQPPSPKKQRVGKAKVLEPMEPPPPMTEPGYPVRVIGRVVRHYQSKQIHADSIDLCPSSLDEITHLEHVIDLHKTKYSLAIPFVPPPKPSLNSPLDTPVQVDGDPDAGVFSNTSPLSHPGSATVPYTLPAPPRMQMPLQDRNRPPPLPVYAHFSYHGHSHVPSSPTASSIVSSTPSSPCKPSSPVKAHVLVSPRKPKLRHPSRLHSRDLTSNTFRLYLKHYMDNAPPPFSVSVSRSSPCRNTRTGVTTPMKRARRSDDEDNEPTPRPIRGDRKDDTGANGDDIQDHSDGPTLGFTLSHLRRVPELALLASRVVRAEQRKREKAERDKERANTSTPSSASVSSRSNRRHGSGSSANGHSGGTVADPSRKKIKRLFSWAVVKLYEDGSIFLWDGDVRPLPVPPPPVPEGSNSQELAGSQNGLWKCADDTWSTLDHSYACNDSIPSTFLSASMLYTSSASASLYSHYHAPRRPECKGTDLDAGSGAADMDADTGDLSDPPLDEEAYVPLTSRLLAGYVKEAMDRMGRVHERAGGGRRTRLSPEEILRNMQRADTRWARVGVWAVEEALATLNAGAPSW